MLQLVMSKEKINCFMKNEDLDSSEINERFGLDGDILDMLLTKEQDKDGKTYIAWEIKSFLNAPERGVTPAIRWRYAW
ncbi:hypothetical protein OE903_23200 [Bacillus sp. B6(2022)]|nr:hypothetical protein [Bacillus sp. B6(2022)]